MIIGRSSRLTHFLEWRDYKIVFKRYHNPQVTFHFRYASLYFAAGIEKEDNELIVLDVIHHFVETLDRYFGNVCELDLIFNFH
jgi:AP-1 complex subunit sigma 1/2